MFIQLPVWKDPELNYGNTNPRVLVNANHIVAVDNHTRLYVSVTLINKREIKTSMSYDELYLLLTD